MNSRILILGLLCIGALLSFSFVPRADEGGSYWERQLKNGKMNLPVKAIRQLKITSCGEAAIVMAYNYAYPESQVSEAEVIEYAADEGYYTERKPPFTSPENMVKIAEHYADTVSAGKVNGTDEGLALLTEKLTSGDPVIIDALARLNDSKSGAHFIVVTGMVIDLKNPKAIKIYYNDPQLGKNMSSDWLGSEGIWNAWQNNGDPGGSGWWMMISSP